MKHDSPVWFITGCSTGIGRELALLLLKQGYRVAATARDASKIDDLVRTHADTALALRLDVTDKASITAAVKEAERRFGQIDVLVNNAGYRRLSPVEDVSADEWRTHLDVNLSGTFYCCQAAIPYLRASDRARIINLSSGVTREGHPQGGAAYVAAKAGVNGLTRALALELGREDRKSVV